MGWFDEQIKARKQADLDTFEDSFQAIAGAVMGRRMSRAAPGHTDDGIPKNR